MPDTTTLEDALPDQAAQVGEAFFRGGAAKCGHIQLCRTELTPPLLSPLEKAWARERLARGFKLHMDVLSFGNHAVLRWAVEDLLPLVPTIRKLPSSSASAAYVHAWLFRPSRVYRRANAESMRGPGRPDLGTSISRLSPQPQILRQVATRQRQMQCQVGV